MAQDLTDSIDLLVYYQFGLLNIFSSADGIALEMAMLFCLTANLSVVLLVVPPLLSRLKYLNCWLP